MLAIIPFYYSENIIFYMFTQQYFNCLFRLCTESFQRVDFLVMNFLWSLLAN
uniref:Uncharacterized protein n=1 Tax=Rhizophora mucronata TaxID=61149 RepID=A0A2P2PID2_RHIMU